MVTETSGPLRSRRVVRGRERECADLEPAAHAGRLAADAPDGLRPEALGAGR